MNSKARAKRKERLAARWQADAEHVALRLRERYGIEASSAALVELADSARAAGKPVAGARAMQPGGRWVDAPYRGLLVRVLLVEHAGQAWIGTVVPPHWVPHGRPTAMWEGPRR